MLDEMPSLNRKIRNLRLMIFAANFRIAICSGEECQTTSIGMMRTSK